MKVGPQQLAPRPAARRQDRRCLLQAAAASAALGALGLPAIGRAQSGALNVGVLLPMSGTQALIGQSCRLGAAIAPAVLADLGYRAPVKLLQADTETNVDTARARAEKLINDGAHVLVGPFDSGAAAAIAQVAEQRGVPFVINIAAAPQITEQGYQFVFRNFPTSVDLVRNGLALMRELFQATNVAPRSAVFMCVNDTFGVANRKAIEAILPRLDFLPFKILDTIAYDPAARDLSVEVAKAKSANADFLLLVSRLNDAILLRREMVRQRWTPMGVISPGSPGMYEKQFYQALGKLSEYCISNVPWYNPKAPLAGRLEAQLAKQFPQEQLMFHAVNVGYTFEAILIAADAYQRARTTEPKALAAAIRQTDIAARAMLGGPIKFNAKGQVEGNLSACIQNLDLHPTVVLPAASAQAKAVFPVPDYKKA